jgi:hypothetical protein
MAAMKEDGENDEDEDEEINRTNRKFDRGKKKTKNKGGSPSNENNDNANDNADKQNTNFFCVHVFFCNCNRNCWIVWLTILGITLLAFIGVYVVIHVTDNINNINTTAEGEDSTSLTQDKVEPPLNNSLTEIVVPTTDPLPEEYQVARRSDIQAELVRLMENNNDVVQHYKKILNQGPDSPQYKAFEWIVHQDVQQVSAIISDSSSQLAHIYSLAVLYYSVMAAISPIDSDDSSMMIPKSWLSKEHECVWEGVTCGPPLSTPLLLNSTTASSSTTTAQV